MLMISSSGSDSEIGLSSWTDIMEWDQQLQLSKGQYSFTES